MTISRISFQADGNAEKTTTVKMFMRDESSTASLRSSLPDAIAKDPMTMFDGNIGYIQIGANLTSKFIMDALTPHLPEAAQSVVRQQVSNAVVAAQTAEAGLHQIAGIAQIAMDTAAQTVTTAIAPDRSVSLS